MIDQALAAFIWVLATAIGVTTACALLAVVATVGHRAWTAARYTRPGWWLHRHLPTPKRP